MRVSDNRIGLLFVVPFTLLVSSSAAQYADASEKGGPPIKIPQVSGPLSRGERLSC